MQECHACRAAATAECSACGRPVCESHAAVVDHDCDPRESAPRKNDRTSVEIDNSSETNVRIDNSQIGSVRVNGSGPTDDDAVADDSDVDVDRLSDLIDLKARMDEGSSGEPDEGRRSTAAVKALEQASELKAAATDPSTEREDLTARIDRLVGLIDRIDDVSGQELRDVADVEAALGDMRTSRLSEAERRRLRNAVEALEDELHVAV
ncbi:hypothetical protein EXE46_07755 [Halorubrum sp. GN11_10-6_MGM]|uniref:hypothetical protein n=1 Tax=Halorubrum sp. GN11_10-6_MGM TaxID=2518112 RepID=UPI0010F54DC0|nr:hypothetical protein [Halorubrum sp. GN11_10-6_MGM]TKX74751.1 hypothetical protein EXE46_07755 [Halorubrum sp. GN11_10-6_MGM]